MRFGQVYSNSDAVPFPLHHSSRYMTLMCLTIDDLPVLSPVKLQFSPCN